MKTKAILAFAILTSLKTFGQIDMTDSTFQAIGYWEKGEIQKYYITEEKYKVNNNDTSSRELCKYELDITIEDSTADSYIIDWFYKNVTIESDNELVQKLSSIVEDMHIKIKTNELGVFVEVINWKDIQKYILKATALLKDEMKDIPNIDKVIKQAEDMYSSKEAIEATAVKEIHQFYSFHGGKYKLWEEYNAKIQLPNIFGGDPFDADVTVWLDEINTDENNVIIRMQQVVDPTQLTNATYDYLVKMASTLNIPGPKREDIPPLENTTMSASRIHGSGWIIYSIETKEIMADNITNIEERIIEIQ